MTFVIPSSFGFRHSSFPGLDGEQFWRAGGEIFRVSPLPDRRGNERGTQHNPAFQRERSANPLANFHHSPEVIGLKFLHHLAGRLLGLLPAEKFLGGKRTMHVGTIIHGEDVELGALFCGVGEDDRGHGELPSLETADSIICTSPARLRFTATHLGLRD
jgi:hypothetical protein